jgi:hypothetical protein
MNSAERLGEYRGTGNGRAARKFPVSLPVRVVPDSRRGAMIETQKRAPHVDRGRRLHIKDNFCEKIRGSPYHAMTWRVAAIANKNVGEEKINAFLRSFVP